MAWLDQFHRWFANRRMVQSRRWDQDGLHAVEGELRTDIAWSDVRRVYAYKKDCITFDEIRLVFLSDQHGIEFTEDDPAFSDLCNVLSEKLGISQDWHSRLITSPAFETTFTTLYPATSAGSEGPGCVDAAG